MGKGKDNSYNRNSNLLKMGFTTKHITQLKD
jgi:hypothetical protein